MGTQRSMSDKSLLEFSALMDDMTLAELSELFSISQPTASKIRKKLRNGEDCYKKDSVKVSSRNRSEAKANGLSEYIGMPCGKCGNTTRYVWNKSCVCCMRENRKSSKPKKKPVILDVSEDLAKRIEAERTRKLMKRRKAIEEHQARIYEREM